MFRCESWSIKKTEHWIIDAFELWCWRRLLKVPWTARRSNQSILKETIGRADVEAEALILWPPDMKSLLIGKIQSKTKLWCWGRLKAGGEGGNRGWDDWSWLNGHEFEQTLMMVKDREPGVPQSMESQRVGLKDLATEQQFLISSCFNWLFQWTYLQQHLVELVKRASSLLSFREN